jgi:hypothetical protein
VPNPFLVQSGGGYGGGRQRFHRPHYLHRPEDEEDDHLCAPTLGRCPMCRAEMSLFDLTIVSQRSISSSPSSSQQQSLQPSYQKVDIPAIVKHCDLVHSPLQGMIFVERQRREQQRIIHPREGRLGRREGAGMGRNSFHFPVETQQGQQQRRRNEEDEGRAGTTTGTTTSSRNETTSSNPHATSSWSLLSQDDDDSNLLRLPYLDLSCLVPDDDDDDDDDDDLLLEDAKEKSFWKLDNGKPLPQKVYFESGCHYHHPTQTFHGTIQWGCHNNNNNNNVTTPRPRTTPNSSDTNVDVAPTEEKDKEEEGGSSTIVLSSTDDCCLFHGSRQWDYILGFSSDLRWIARGLCVARRPPSCVNPNCSRYDCKFPMDGLWTVTIRDKGENDDDDNDKKRPITSTTRIEVRGNQFTLNLHHVTQNAPYSYSYPPWSQVYLLQFPPDIAVGVSFAMGPVTLVAKSDWKTFPQHGPAIGESLEWTDTCEQVGCTPPVTFTMTWTRESKSPTSYSPLLQVIPYGPDTVRKKQYHRHFATSSSFNNNNNWSETAVSRYNPESLVGNTFCQSLMVGLASYHFVLDEHATTPSTSATTMTVTTEGQGVTTTTRAGHRFLAAYISYEHEHVAQWPPLDNGSPVPSRIWFTNTSFDATTRTFRGTIDWEGTQHTTWQGDRSWR